MVAFILILYGKSLFCNDIVECVDFFILFLIDVMKVRLLTKTEEQKRELSIFYCVKPQGTRRFQVQSPQLVNFNINDVIHSASVWTNCVVMQRRVFIQTILFSETRACVCAWGVDPVLPVQPADLLPLIQRVGLLAFRLFRLLLGWDCALRLFRLLLVEWDCALCLFRLLLVEWDCALHLFHLLLVEWDCALRLFRLLLVEWDCLCYACLVPPPTSRIGLLVLHLFCLRSHPFVMLNGA